MSPAARNRRRYLLLILAGIIGIALSQLLPEARAERAAVKDAASGVAADTVIPPGVTTSTAMLDAKHAPDAKAEKEVAPAPAGVGKDDWGQWGGSTIRNNVPRGKDLPTEWNVGKFDNKTGKWLTEKAKNVKWAARLGSQSYGNPVVANGQCYVGTNNGGGWVKRYPSSVDLGCLLCFKESDGSFLWQHSSEKLPTGRVHDWPLQGVCCAPLVEGERLWFVTNRGEVACLDTQGFRDGENDGPYKEEQFTADDEADTIWRLDMMKQLGISQHNMCSCSVTAVGDLLFVNTSNGVDEGHVNLPAPSAPTFVALNKNTGELLWADNSPGVNVLHGQWSSPAYAVLEGVPQVIFGGGDGYLYSFLGDATTDGKPHLLWKFDCNPKESKYVLGGRANRNHVIGTPVIVDGLVYVGVGEDPEHGEGVGHLWCIDPNKRGDVSPELAYNVSDLTKPIPHRRIQAVVKENGEVARPNKNSAAVWHYANNDTNQNGKIEFEETMHRTCGTVAIKDGLLFVADFSGLFHCLDQKTGKPHWTYDMLAEAWGSPCIVDGNVYIGDSDGDMAVFKLSKKMTLVSENTMGTSVYSTPIVANNTLFIANKDHLFALAEGAKAAAPPESTPAAEEKSTSEKAPAGKSAEKSDANGKSADSAKSVQAPTPADKNGDGKK